MKNDAVGVRSSRRRRSGALVTAGVLLAVVGLSLSGCASANLAPVKPWQRGTLADYTMRPDRDPLNTAMAEHIYFSRETATGGRGVGGSGCGCN